MVLGLDEPTHVVAWLAGGYRVYVGYGMPQKGRRKAPAAANFIHQKFAFTEPLVGLFIVFFCVLAVCQCVLGRRARYTTYSVLLNEKPLDIVFSLLHNSSKFDSMAQSFSEMFK